MISVLYVDDEPGLLEIARIFLEQSGEFRVTTSTSAHKALDTPFIQSTDAIVADYQMPGMDGIAFLKVVRERFGDVPFILFTGRGREEIVIDAINHGADFYLQKGGDPTAQFAELGHKIRQAVRRKQAEHSLHDSERRLADIIDFLPDATFAIDRSGHVIAWNHAIEEMTGIPSSTMLGRGAYEYAVPFYGSRRPILIDLVDEPDDRIRQFYSDITRSGSSLTAQTDLPHPKGNQIAVLAKACLLYNQAGEITGAIESIRDITELKKAEQALRRSEERYRSIVNDQAEMIMRFTRDGTITFVNEALRSLFVPIQEMDEIVGMNIHELVQIGGIDNKSEILRGFTPTAPVRELEQEVSGSDGRIHWQHWSIRAFFDGGSDPVEYQVVGRDITEQRRVEVELKESETRYRELADLLPQIIYELDTDLRITYANQHALTKLGITDQEIRDGLNALSFIDPAEHQRIKAKIRTFQNGTPSEPEEFTALRKDGSAFPVIVYQAPIVRDSRHTGYRGVIVDISTRKRMEEELKKNHHILEDAMNLARLANWEVDLNTDLCTFNDRFYAFCGTTAEREGGYRMPAAVFFQEFVDPDDRRIVDDLMETARRSTDPHAAFQDVYRMHRRDGEVVRYVLTRCEVARDAEGRPVTLYGVNQDITEQRTIENALRESEEEFHTMAERSSDLILIIDERMSVVYASPSARPITGYAPEELIGKTYEFAEETIFSTCISAFSAAVSTAMNGLTVEPVEMQILRKDGATGSISMYAVPVIRDGVFSGAQVSIRDITERQRTENALRESEEKFLSFVENSNRTIYSLTPDGILTYVSPQWTESMGYEPDEVLGRSFERLVHPDDLPACREFLRQILTTGKRQKGIEYRVRHKDGRWLWHTTSASPIHDLSGRITSVLGINSDITEIRRAGEALRRANLQLTLLAGLTRHDILNKVSVLLGYLKIAEETCTDPDLAQLLERMEPAVAAIQSQIEFTRVYEDIGTCEPRWIALETVLPRAQVPATITLVSEVHGLQVFADPMLEKVFSNLLDNSVRHGQRVTEVRVSAHQTAGDLVVVWEDDGVGIPADEKERIFERGFGNHTGIGLFLVREILALTGIAITETGEPGKGVRFEMTVQSGGYRSVGEEPTPPESLLF